MTSSSSSGGAGGGGGAATTTSSSTASTGGAGGGGGATSSSSSGSGGASLCGNGVKDTGEQCDGTDFGPLTCQLLGLGSGSLLCNSYCTIVATNCKPKENCINNEDDNGDGLIDCQDPECDGNAACADTCTPPASISIPGYEYSDFSGRPAVHKASCSVSSGREIIYELVAPTDGNLIVDVYSYDADVTVSVRTACGDDSSEIACVNKVASGDDEILAVPVTAGTTYFVMIDGNTENDFGSFSIDVDVPPPEDSCTNESDDDNDGYVDCDDANACQTMPECAPGTGVVGTACLQNSECAANHNDPICLSEYLGFPDGYCSEFCDQTADDCATGSICYTDLKLSVHGVCLATCTQDSDCRTGYACAEKGLAQKVCVLPPEPSCTNYDDDDSNDLIDCQDPACQARPDCVPGDKAPGQPCTANTDCFADNNDPICMDSSLGFTDGYCSQFCEMNDDCGIAGVCTYEGPHGSQVCLKACTTSNQCPAGTNCLDFGYPKKICL
ncbi:Hypothetical protein A7982_09341 [Minicystis rosea]|nr:Hypothetical protein A7982_09341 [Minicystis rosea]